LLAPDGAPPNLQQQLQILNMQKQQIHMRLQ
jgi:chaperonin cofactor prefoldin